MLCFKKKKKDTPHSVLYYTLNDKLNNAREQGKHSFYHSLYDEEEYKIATIWALRNHLWLEVSHKNGDILVYKFTGV